MLKIFKHTFMLTRRAATLAGSCFRIVFILVFFSFVGNRCYKAEPI